MAASRNAVCTGMREVNIWVREGQHDQSEKEEAIFNPNCRNVSLLSLIRDKCDCPTDVDVELCDESGNLKHLRDNPQRFASELLNPREKFVLIRVERRDSGDSKFVPLLNDRDSVTSSFLATLQSRAGSDRASSRRNNSSGSRSRQRSPTGRSTSTGNKHHSPVNHQPKASQQHVTINTNGNNKKSKKKSK